MSAVPAHLHCVPCVSVVRVYHRRRPERTALYRLVQHHHETWLARRRKSDPNGAPIPPRVKREPPRDRRPLRQPTTRAVLNLHPKKTI